MQQQKLNHDGIISIEQQILKTPMEIYKRSFRNSQKLLERELQNVIAYLAAEREKDQAGLEKIIARLETLQNRLDTDMVMADDEFMATTGSRIEHLDDLCKVTSAESEGFERWGKIRLGRSLVDYMLRRGCMESAKALSDTLGVSKLVDINPFIESQKIVADLRSKSTTLALNWANENRSSLKKAKSSFEFSLRNQEYIELLRAGLIKQALAHCKKYLVIFADTHLKEIQKCMGLLAFQPDTDCDVYATMYSCERWEGLILEFQSIFNSLNSLPKESSISKALSAGLSALKTRQCGQIGDINSNCPVCDPDFGALAAKLPKSHFVISCLVCRITGKVMDADNPPVVLPNGYAYSTEAIEAMVRNTGSITCPRTLQVFAGNQSRKCFIS